MTNNSKKKHDNEEEGIGLQKCLLVNITKNGMEKEWPSSFFSFFLEVLAKKHTRFLSFFLSFFHYIFELFYNEYLLLFVFYSSYSSFIYFLVFFTSYLEVFASKHPLSLLFFFIILMKKWRKEKKREKNLQEKGKKKKEEEEIRGEHL